MKTRITKRGKIQGRTLDHHPNVALPSDVKRQWIPVVLFLVKVLRLMGRVFVFAVYPACPKPEDTLR